MHFLIYVHLELTFVTTRLWFSKFPLILKSISVSLLAVLLFICVYCVL